MKISGILIAGGKSKRMGTDKSLLTYGQQSFMERAVNLLRQFTDDLLISSNTDYRDFPYKFVSDNIPNTGPIGGLYACLPLIKHDSALVMPVDMPLLTTEVFSYLLRQADFSKTVNIFKANDRMQMLTGLYHKDLMPVLKQQIGAGDYKLQNLLKKTSHHIIDAGDFSSQFININTPESLQKLQERNG